MLRDQFSAHIGYLFSDLPIEERVIAAAAAGFTAVEHPQPFALDQNHMRRLLIDNGLFFAQLAGGAGDPSRGEKGLAALPGREADFRAGFDRSLEYAVAVGSPYIHPMAGVPPVEDDAQWCGVYRENIQYAVEQTSRTGVKVLIEAISSAAIPGYAISSLGDAMRVQDAFGLSNIALLVDTYHARSTGIDPAKWLRSNLNRVGHIHIADYPGRHEPGTGDIDFDEVLRTLTEQQFDGAIGFEFVPTTTTQESVMFLNEWKSRAQQ